MSHTPGPWKEVEYTDYELKGCGSIQGINNQMVVSPRQGVCGRNTGEAEANARLIAAAPTLLEALKRVVTLKRALAAARAQP